MISDFFLDEFHFSPYLLEVYPPGFQVVYLVSLSVPPEFSQAFIESMPEVSWHTEHTVLPPIL